MRTRKSRCLHCGTVLDAASVVREAGRWPHNDKPRFDMSDDVEPRPGDFTVCIKCGHLSTFGEDLRLRDPTDEEAIKIAGDPVLLAIQWARGETMKKQGGKCRHGLPRMLCRECSTATAVIALPDRSKESLR